MNLEQIVNEYLASGTMMQLATCHGGKPWVCTVYFVADKHRNIYWISKPETRHSLEITKNKDVAATIPLRFHPGEPGVALQLEGQASEVGNTQEIAEKMRLYVEKFASGEEFYNGFIAGANEHYLFKLVPTRFVVVDSERLGKDNFSELIV